MRNRRTRNGESSRTGLAQRTTVRRNGTPKIDWRHSIRKFAHCLLFFSKSNGRSFTGGSCGRSEDAAFTMTSPHRQSASRSTTVRYRRVKLAGVKRTASARDGSRSRTEPGEGPRGQVNRARLPQRHQRNSLAPSSSREKRSPRPPLFFSAPRHSRRAAGRRARNPERQEIENRRGLRSERGIESLRQ